MAATDGARIIVVPTRPNQLMMTLKAVGANPSPTCVYRSLASCACYIPTTDRNGFDCHLPVALFGDSVCYGGTNVPCSISTAEHKLTLALGV